MYEHHLNR